MFIQPPMSAITNVYTVPFSRTVWMCSGSSLVLVAILLLISLYCEDKFSEEDKFGPLWRRLLDVALVTLGAICQQGEFLFYLTREDTFTKIGPSTLGVA